MRGEQFLRAEDTVGTVGWLKGELRLLWLVANFQRFKSKKTPAGRVALDYWLGCYRLGNRVGTFTKYGVRELADLDQGGSWQWLLWRLVSSRVDLGAGSTSVALAQGLTPMSWVNGSTPEIQKMCNILTFKGQCEYKIAIGYYKCTQTEVKQNFVEFKKELLQRNRENDFRFFILYLAF